MNETVNGVQVSGGTDVAALVLFGIIGLMILGVLIFVILMYRKRYMRNRMKFNIIPPDSKMYSARIKDVQKINTVNKKKYMFVEDCVIQKTWGREIYYFEGVPNPIKFTYNRKDPKIELSSTELQSVIEEKVTEKMLGESSISTQDILLIIAIGLGAVSCFFLFQMYSGGVEMSAKPENIETLKTIFRSVVTGS